MTRRVYERGIAYGIELAHNFNSDYYARIEASASRTKARASQVRTVRAYALGIARGLRSVAGLPNLTREQIAYRKHGNI